MKESTVAWYAGNIKRFGSMKEFRAWSAARKKKQRAKNPVKYHAELERNRIAGRKRHEKMIGLILWAMIRHISTKTDLRMTRK